MTEPFFRHCDEKSDRRVGFPQGIASGNGSKRIAETRKLSSSRAEEYLYSSGGTQLFLFI